PWLDVYGLMSLSKLRFFSRPMLDLVAEQVPYADLQLNREKMQTWHPLHRGLYLGARIMLPGLLLMAKGDRVAMHSSVETRYPFPRRGRVCLPGARPPAVEITRIYREIPPAPPGGALVAARNCLAAQGHVPRSDGQFPRRQLAAIRRSTAQSRVAPQDRLL